MLETLIAFATVLLSTAGGVGAAFVIARWEVRNTFAQHDATVRDMLERSRINMAAAEDAINVGAERVARERARIEQVERRRAPAAAPDRPYSDPASYKRFLQRGGRRDRDFEAMTQTPNTVGAPNG